MKLWPRISTIIFTFALSALGAQAQWDKKLPSEWSEKEVQKLLNDSPWSQTQTFSDTAQMFGNEPLSSGTSRVANVFHVNFRLRFLSAKPVRQAISRQLELQQKGKLSPQLATQLQAFAAADFPDYIVITALCDSDQPNAHLQEANALLNNRTTADLKNNTFLEVKGGRRVFLHEYQPPRNDGLGARFVFPRLVDNEPFLTPQSGEVRFYAELSTGGAVSGSASRTGASSSARSLSYKLDRRFKLAAMAYQGKLEY